MRSLRTFDGCRWAVALGAGLGCGADDPSLFGRPPEVDVAPASVVQSPETTEPPIAATVPEPPGSEPPQQPPPSEEDPGAVEPSAGNTPPAPVDEPEVVADADGVLIDPVACAEGFGPFAAPEVVTGLGVEGSIFGPVLSGDGATLIFSAIVGDGDENILTANRLEFGSAFGEASLVANLDADGSTEGTPFLTANGLSLYFFSTRVAPGVVGSRDIWVSRRSSAANAFGEPEVVPGVNSADLDHLPWVSEDGLTLMLVSDRPSPNGASNIWVSERARVDQEFPEPVEVEGINTQEREEGFALSRDGLSLFFASNRSGAAGMDLWVALRADLTSAFEAPVNIAGLNSPADDLDAALSADETELFFVSDRNGPIELFRAVRDCLAD